MITLTSFLSEQTRDGQLIRLIDEVIPQALLKIRAAIESETKGYVDTENPSGERQLALDVQSNDILRKAFAACGLVHSIASEEEQAQVQLNSQGPFTVCFDPLDGSSLADVNFAVGTIIGVYPAGSLLSRTGDDQLASCFAVYGPRTTLMLTLRKGTHAFRMASDGKFYLEKNDIKVDSVAKYFAPGNLRITSEREDYFKLVTSWMRKGLTLRYSGGMVPDINHIFMKGSGIFCYPGAASSPRGKLRLLFECAPMALLMEQAGGVALDGNARILEQKVSTLAQPTPIFIGSKETVAEACAMMP